MRTRSKLLVTAITIAVVVVALRAALPYTVAYYVNDALARMGDYSGRVGNVDLALVRGAYVLDDVVIVKRGADVDQPFLEMRTMDISLEWKALLNGEMVGEIVAHNPIVNMVQAETARDTQTGAGVNWPAQVRELFPFRFNRVEVVDGVITFRAPGIETEDALTLREADMVLRNLTNVEQRERSTFASAQLTGKVMGNAPLRIAGQISPTADVPTFDLNLSLDSARLVDVNPWLERFLNVDAEQGAFSLYIELAASDGRFEGYFKPIMENPKVFRIDEPATGPFRKAWEALVELATGLFQNPPSEQVATQVPISGELENPDTDVLTAAVNLMRNAFVAAFTHSIEGSVSLQDIPSEENTESESPETTEDERKR